MHFDTGKFGAVVIVLALIGTIVLGYCTDVTKVEGVRTDYDFITDITGLFETEQVPEYIEYNPNSNYVGYTGPVVYDVSSQPNNYRFESAPGTTSTDSDLLYYTEIRDIPTEMSPMSAVYLNYTGSSYSLTPQFSSGTGGTYNVYTFVNTNVPSVTTLKEIIDNAEINLSGYRTLEIDFSFTNVNYPVFAFQSFSSFVVQNTGGVKIWTANATDDNVVDRMVIDVTTLSVRAYRGSVEVWTGLANTIPVVYSYQANNYTGSQTSDNVPITLDMDFALTTPPVYGYADPTGGVRLAGGYDTVVWNNGYSVEEVTIYLGQYDYPRQSAVNILFYPTGNSFNQNLWVSFSNVLEIRVYDHQIDGVSTYTFGKWQGVEITYNRSTGIITATPTGTISDYTVGSSVKGTETQITRGWGGSETAPTDSSITFRTGSNVPSPYIGVYRTIVDLNSYNVVMNNPTINIKDYWPNLDDYRLNFYSFALVGESVTINGVQYPIGDGQTITVTESVAEGETAETFTKTLSNIYVSTDTVDGVRHTYLTFVDDRLSVDLGETVTEVVSFSGLWYFTTALYDAEQVSYSEYEWNLDGKFGLSYDVVFLIFIGLCIVGIVLGKVFLSDSMHFLDYVLIIGAIVIAYACMEVFL